MKSYLAITAAIAIVGSSVFLAAQLSAGADQPKKPQPMLMHNVFFALKDPTDAAKRDLVAGCRTYLSGQPGAVFFAAGVLAEECNRPVNDRDFDVALHIVFKDKAAHDAYQKNEQHLAFAKQYDSLFKKIRVFDSLVEK